MKTVLVAGFLVLVLIFAPVVTMAQDGAVTVGIGINYMKAIRTTESFLWNDEDEVYVIVAGGVRTASGELYELSAKHVGLNPSEFEDGWERFDYYHLMGDYHQLNNGDELQLVVYIMEDDEGWDPIQCGPLRETMASLGSTIVSAISQNWLSATASAGATAAVGYDFLDNVGSCGDDTIGAFSVAVVNAGGNLSVDWKSIGDTEMRPSGSIDTPVYYELHNLTALFRMLEDSRGEYLVDVGVWVP